MSDVALFVTVFIGLLICRIIAATAFFFFILPRGDRCPNCDAVTVRVQSRVWNRLVPMFRTSWCAGCGWDGLLKPGPLSPPASPEELAAAPRERRVAHRRP